jgi:Zn-dependent protease with chaperone function
MNNLKTFFLLTLLTLIAIGVGDYFGGQNGMILGFIIAGITNFISYFFSDKIALAMYRAQLARALQKLDASSKRVPLLASPSTAHMFIVQPLMGVNIGSRFSTHPPIHKRIERLTGQPQEYQ